MLTPWAFSQANIVASSKPPRLEPSMVPPSCWIDCSENFVLDWPKRRKLAQDAFLREYSYKRLKLACQTSGPTWWASHLHHADRELQWRRGAGVEAVVAAADPEDRDAVQPMPGVITQ